MPVDRAKNHVINFSLPDGPVAPALFSKIHTQARQFLHNETITGQQAQDLASWAASQFWTHYLDGGAYLSGAITLLCELAIQPHPDIAQAGQQAIFSELVEQLSDAFNPDYCTLYDRMFVQIIDWCRRQPAGKSISLEMDRFGFHTAQDLLKRKQRLDAFSGRFQADPTHVKKIILLSRVTLGSEIAVTATLIAALKSIFGDVHFVLLAAPAMRQIFAGDEHISIYEVRYNRNQGFIEQFDTWLVALQAIRAETEGLRPDEFIVIDPDSRLTQLGLLPVMDDESGYFFFPSRSFGKNETQSIGELANQWANQIFGSRGIFYPELNLSKADRRFAQALRNDLGQAGVSQLVTINFGVGGNMTKRLSEEFEYQLVAWLIANGNSILLAKGIGPEEIERSNRLLERMRDEGKQIREIDAGETLDVLPENCHPCDILAWQGSVGTYCALIGESDRYIGYDSGGQHIAAALGTPTVDIFAHSPYPLFMQRWRPYGRGSVHVIDATAYNISGKDDFQSLLEQIMGLARQK